MKRWYKIANALRYLTGSLIVAMGLGTLVGSGGDSEGFHAEFTAKPRRGLAPLEVIFDASGSSGSIGEYWWDFGDGEIGGGVTVTHTYTTPGNYIVYLSVYGPEGPPPYQYSDHAQTGIVVDGSINAAFTAQPTSGLPPLEVSFDASSSSDEDGTIVSYEWDFDDGQSGEGITTTHTYTSIGVYSVTLNVTNDSGATHSTEHEIRVGVPTAAFTAQPITGVPPLEVTFDASASFYPHGSIVAYNWSFGDGDTGQGITTTHTYTSLQTYWVQLTVQNDIGAIDSVTQFIRVGTPTAAFTAQPTSGPAPLEVFFDASASSDPDGTIVYYHWSFGEFWGSGEGVTASHVYTIPGTYFVSLYVRDNDYFTDQITQVITVEAN